MIVYIGILEKEPESLWGIWFPDLPGCVTAAETSELTIEQAAEALDLWVTDALDCGEDLPQSRSLDELRRDPEVAAALAKGDAAVVVARPSSNDQVSLGRNALAAVDAAAARSGVTRLDYVQQAVPEKLAS